MDIDAAAFRDRNKYSRNGETATVLLVEDDDLMREMLAKLLAESGFVVLQAENAERAAEIARRKKRGIALLLTDVRMPGMSGIDLADELMVRPDMKVLFISGYPTNAHGQSLAGSHYFLQKPFTPEEVVAKVLEILR
jgi:two-component system cell cycle sensor histidine kinase/response regulator CckA